MENVCPQSDFLILIDIPKGLKTGGIGEQLSDLEARNPENQKIQYLPVPCRTVYAESYEKACKVNKELSGKSISKQTWSICPKSVMWIVACVRMKS